MTEVELLERCRAGDGGAFRELIGRHHSQAWAVCLQITGNRADAEDALQDALISASQNLHRFRGQAKFSTWLHRISANAALALVRRRREVVSPTADQAEQADPSSLTADRVVDVDAVRQALAQLPEDFRVAIVLRECADMSYADIAEHQEIGVGTVKTRISRGRAHLLRLLAPAAG